MSKKKKTGVLITTPKGIANWPRLNAPDTKYDKDGKYTCKLILDGNDPAVQAFVARLEKMRDDFFDAEVARLKSEKKAGLAAELGKDPVVKVERDQETGEETGRLILSASLKASGTRDNGEVWTQSPDIFDARGTQLKNPPLIYGGTELKLSIEFDAFIKQDSKKAALSAKLKAAQIIKLVTAGGRDFSGYGFQAEDGDEIEDGEAPAFQNETAGGGGASDDNDDI